MEAGPARTLDPATSGCSSTNFVRWDVGLVALGERLDMTTPAGRMAFGIFASVAEFERERLRERTLLGLDRARARGKKLGRPVDAALRARLAECDHLSVREAAKRVGCSTATVQKVRKAA